MGQNPQTSQIRIEVRVRMQANGESQVGISPRAWGARRRMQAGAGLEQGQSRAQRRLKWAGTRLRHSWGRNRNWIKGRPEAWGVCNTARPEEGPWPTSAVVQSNFQL